jgi:hypothetical protein
MRTNRVVDRRVNLLRSRPLVGWLSEVCLAPADGVYDLLADLSSHLAWGGGRRSKRSRLLWLDAPPGPAQVGTEFTTSGEDSMARMIDGSVVTEATRPFTFEFVTESAWELKRGGRRADCTIVHRYDVAPTTYGCRVTYTIRITRMSALPGPLAILRIPGLRRIAKHRYVGSLRGGFRNLLQMAESVRGEGGRATWKREPGPALCPGRPIHSERSQS